MTKDELEVERKKMLIEDKYRVCAWRDFVEFFLNDLANGRINAINADMNAWDAEIEALALEIQKREKMN